MDIRMPRTDGIEATKQIKSDLHLKDTRVLIFTSNDNQNDLFAALGAGADGYCVKDTPAEQLILAIQTVHSGATWLDPQIARLVLSTATASQAKERSSVSARPAPPFALSAREMDVLRLLVEGLSNSEMADRLIISIETVKTHMRRIMEKLQVSDRTQAAVKAMRAGLV
jgi:DNA-binding NarL/FixJ family response regulator